MCREEREGLEIHSCSCMGLELVEQRLKFAQQGRKGCRRS